MKSSKNLKKLLSDTRNIINEKTITVMFDGKEFKLFDPITELTINDYTTINSKKVVSEKTITGNRISNIIRCFYEYNDDGQTVRVVKREDSKKIAPVNRIKNNEKETMRFEYYKNGKLKSIIGENQRYDYRYRNDRTTIKYHSEDRDIYTVKDDEGYLIKNRVEVSGLGIVNKYESKTKEDITITKEVNYSYSTSGELNSIITETRFYNDNHEEPFYITKVNKDMISKKSTKYSIEYIVDEHDKYIGYVENYDDDKYHMEFHYKFVFDKKGRVIEILNDHEGKIKCYYHKGYDEKISYLPVQGITSIHRVGKNKSEYIEVYKDILKIQIMTKNLEYSAEINGDQVISEYINFRKRNKEYSSEISDICVYTNNLETYDKDDNLLTSEKVISPNNEITEYIKSITGLKFGLDTVSIFTDKKIVEEVEYAKKEKSRKNL